jgi:hypothetical protein
VLNLCYRGRWLRVTAARTSASYALLAGQPLQLTHYETRLTLTLDGPATYPIPQAPVPPRPTQPPGREPLRRRATPHTRPSRWRNEECSSMPGCWRMGDSLQLPRRPEGHLCGWTAFERSVNFKRAATAANARSGGCLDVAQGTGGQVSHSLVVVAGT